MTFNDFDDEEAKKFLIQRESKKKEEEDQIRKEVLETTIRVLKEEFGNSSVEIYLVGSILRPFQFNSLSDVDIVIKGFKGDRFDLWPKLERKIGRNIEIIRFETYPFQEFILKEGLKVH